MEPTITVSPEGEGERSHTTHISRNELLCTFLKLPSPFPPEMPITGNFAKTLYGIPNPASSFVIVACFSINFVYNACDLPGIAGSVSRTFNNLIPETRPEGAMSICLPPNLPSCPLHCTRAFCWMQTSGWASPPLSTLQKCHFIAFACFYKMPVKGHAQQGRPPGQHTLTWLLSKPLLCDVIPSLFWRFSIAISS